MITIGSSVICMDHINLERDVVLAEKLGVDYLHLDVMDGQFVPRYGLYPEIIFRMAHVSEMKMDLHLMVEDPEFAIEQFKNIENIQYISVHIENNEKDILRIVDKIKGYSKKAGIVLNLNTPVTVLNDLIKYSEIDSVMLMGIHPGVLLQKPRPETVIEKSKAVVKLTDDFCKLEMLQCDGAINFDTIPKMLSAGITNFICGSNSLYKGVNLRDPWQKNQKKIERNYKKIRELLN